MNNSSIDSPSSNDSDATPSLLSPWEPSGASAAVGFVEPNGKLSRTEATSCFRRFRCLYCPRVADLRSANSSSGAVMERRRRGLRLTAPFLHPALPHLVAERRSVRGVLASSLARERQRPILNFKSLTTRKQESIRDVTK